MRRTMLIAAMVALSGCALDEGDVEEALRAGLDNASLADDACGFTTFGLRDLQLSDVHIDGQGAGSARLKGVAKDGPKKSEPCAGDITFKYMKGRQVTHGVNGESERIVAVITDIQRK